MANIVPQQACLLAPGLSVHPTPSPPAPMCLKQNSAASTSHSTSYTVNQKMASPNAILALLGLQLCVCVCVCVLVAQLCPTLCDPMDCSPPDSSVHGILQARILEWVASSFSRGSSLTQGLNLGLPHCRQITVWATREVILSWLFWETVDSGEDRKQSRSHAWREMYI